MGLFSRLAHFFRIRASAALDKAEDPGQVMDYSYSKQLEQLQHLRHAIADVVTQEKRLELQQTQIRQRLNKLDQQAMQALQANREDLARMALQKKETLVAQIAGFEQQIAQLQTQEEKLITMERTVSARVEAIKESSCVLYRMMLGRHILPALGHIPVQRLTPQQVQSLYTRKL